MVKKELVVSELSDTMWQGNEAMGCVINHAESSVLVCCVCRPPSASKLYNKLVRKTIRKICNLGHRQILICGDFNHRQIHWAKNHAVGREPKKFFDLCQDMFLHQHVQEHTRSRGSDSPSLLDLVLTKNDLDIETIRYKPPIGKSDHCTLHFEMHIDGGEASSMNTAERKLNFHEGKYVEANYIFTSIKWEDEL